MNHLVKSPLVGTMTKVNVKVGDSVTPDTVVAVMTYAEQEIQIEAEAAGTVSTVLTVEGAMHKKDEILFLID